MNARHLFTTALLFSLAGCGDSESASDSAPAGGGAAPAPQEAGPGATGVSQGGAQDFGLFRQILEDGEIPAPSTLDPLGFFAEHKLDFPAADCGEDLCMHGLLGVQRNMISGSNCTVLQIGLNTPLRPDELERRPLNLVLAIDVSGSMRGGPLQAVRTGLLQMLDHLEPDDRLWIVTYESAAEVRVDGRTLADREVIEDAIGDLWARGGTNIYDGLFQAFDIADAALDPARETRVVLLSDGVATEGLQEPARIQSLAAAYARRGVGITTIGVGTEFDVEVMRALSEVGAGNFYFLEDPVAAEEVFTEEVQAFLVPVALDVRIDVQVGSSYRIGEVYGTNGWRGGRRGGRVEVPSLFLAGRQRADAPIEGGRRGGGGGIVVELIPLSDAADEPARVGVLTLQWTDPRSGEAREQRVEVLNPNAPDHIPEGGYFTDRTVQKGFVMLNLLVGFQMAGQLALDGDRGAAMGVLQALRAEVERWLAADDDPDIADDLRYLDLFIANLQAKGISTPISRPPEPWPRD